MGCPSPEYETQTAKCEIVRKVKAHMTTLDDDDYLAFDLSLQDDFDTPLSQRSIDYLERLIAEAETGDSMTMEEFFA